jgi:dienelactone hydrolase
MRLRTLAAAIVVIVTMLAIAAPLFRSYTRAAALIVGMTGIDGALRDAFAFEAGTYTVSEVTVPSRHGPLRARLFVPDHVRRAVVLVPGIHAIGIDEPRLYNLAIQMAQVGLAVLTPEMPDLARYAITARTTDMIEDASIWLSRRRTIARGGRIGVVGISFAGGLATVAAGRPALRDHVEFVFAFGAHSSFPRVLRFLCTGIEPAELPPPGAPPGTPVREAYRQPHDYGVAVLLLGFADRVVPADQAEPLRAAVFEFLLASCYDLINLQKAVQTYASAERMASALPEPSRTMMRYVNTRNVKALGAVLLPYISQVQYPAALSVDQSPPPSGAMYLLHGTEDNVVPAIETLYLARYIDGHARVRTLLSGLITHAEMDKQKGWREAWELVDFFADLLRE